MSPTSPVENPTGPTSRRARRAPKEPSPRSTETLRARLSSAWHRRSADRPSIEGLPEGVANTTELVRAFLEELGTERREILEPLLHRMSELGERLSEGDVVPPAVLEEGLSLWDAHLQRLRNAHVSQFLSARSSIPHTEACSIGLVQLQDEPLRGATRVQELRTLVSGYEGKPALYRPLLGEVLTAIATSELAWEGFAEDFARTCLPTHLSDSALEQWNTALIEGRAEAAATRTRVRDFVARTESYVHPSPKPKSGGRGSERA